MLAYLRTGFLFFQTITFLRGIRGPVPPPQDGSPPGGFQKLKNRHETQQARQFLTEGSPHLVPRGQGKLCSTLIYKNANSSRKKNKKVLSFTFHTMERTDAHTPFHILDRKRIFGKQHPVVPRCVGGKRRTHTYTHTHTSSSSSSLTCIRMVTQRRPGVKNIFTHTPFRIMNGKRTQTLSLI